MLHWVDVESKRGVCEKEWILWDGDEACLSHGRARVVRDVQAVDGNTPGILIQKSEEAKD
jgi:hypothetical protein